MEIDETQIMSNHEASRLIDGTGSFLSPSFSLELRQNRKRTKYRRRFYFALHENKFANAFDRRRIWQMKIAVSGKGPTWFFLSLIVSQVLFPHGER